MLLAQRLSCATQDSAIAWFQRAKPCSTRPAARRSRPVPPYSSGMVAPKKPLSPITRNALSGHHSSRSIRSESGYTSLRPKRTACCSLLRAKFDARLSPLKIAWDVVMRWFPPSFDESCSLDHRWFYNEYNSFCVMSTGEARLTHHKMNDIHYGPRLPE